MRGGSGQAWGLPRGRLRGVIRAMAGHGGHGATALRATRASGPDQPPSYFLLTHVALAHAFRRRSPFTGRAVTRSLSSPNPTPPASLREATCNEGTPTPCSRRRTVTIIITLIAYTRAGSARRAISGWTASAWPAWPAWLTEADARHGGVGQQRG